MSEIANVIFRSAPIPNLKFEGVPYVESYPYNQSVIFDGPVTSDQIRYTLASAPPDTMVNPWTVQILQGFEAYLPTTFKRATQSMGIDTYQRLFCTDRFEEPGEAVILMQGQTETESKGATIDAAIANYRWDLGTVANKVHLANRLYVIGRIYNHLEKRRGPPDNPFLFGGNIEDPRNWTKIMMDVKQQLMEYLLEMPVTLGTRRYDTVVRGVEATDEELKERFGHVEWLKSVHGDNLVADLLYGSGSRTSDPAKYNDLDNWLVVKDVRKAQLATQGMKPFLFEGKVYTGIPEDQHPKGSKHIGINYFPDNKEYITRHFRFLHDPIEFLLHTKVLYGEFELPVVAQDECIERGICSAYSKLKSVAGALNWGFSWPERVVGKPPLFEYNVKILRFFLQHVLNAMEKPWFRSKEDLDERLFNMGVVIPKYSEDHAHIQNSLLYAVAKIMVLQEHFFRMGRRPNLNFIVDHKYVPADQILLPKDLVWKVKPPKNPVTTDEPYFIPHSTPAEPVDWAMADDSLVAIPSAPN